MRSCQCQGKVKAREKSKPGSERLQYRLALFQQILPMVAMDRLITAVGQGVPATAARRAGHPDMMWAVSTSMDGKVVLTNRKVSKHAKVWLSWLTKDLRTKGRLGQKSSVSSNTIEICVAGTWMSLLDIPTRKRKKKSPTAWSALRRKVWGLFDTLPHPVHAKEFFTG
jgi:hypothetical protein